MFIMKQIYRFLCFQNTITCLSQPTDKYLFKVKSRNTVKLKSTTKTPERCHAVFIFNFEHMQMNLFFYY